MSIRTACLATLLALLAARSAGATVALDLGDASGGRGDTIQVSVLMGGGGGAVKGVQLDILYPDAVLEVPDPNNACHVTSGQPGSAPTSMPASPAPPAGQSRLRFIAIDFGGGTYADGQLVTCSFRVKINAPTGTHTITGDQLRVSDGSGNVLPSTVTNGTLTISCGACC